MRRYHASLRTRRSVIGYMRVRIPFGVQNGANKKLQWSSANLHGKNKRFRGWRALRKVPIFAEVYQLVDSVSANDKVADSSSVFCSK